ncbi:MAG: class I SAM-dependent methyltransferase [Dehalococcoidia bacterium]|jgi:SAM-dependent methyltransferase
MISFGLTNYCLKRWHDQVGSAETVIYKRIIYFLLRPLLSMYYRRYLSENTLRKYKPYLVLCKRGFPLEARRRWGSQHCNIREATILVQGTGTGWDVVSWAKLRPKKIIATDLFDFSESWKEISRYCAELLDVKVEFRQGPLENHSFLPDNSIDLCASDAVFEHCLNLGSILQESFRLLKPGGTLYATYGPLYFCAGGDHFAGRGGLKNAFNHLLLPLDEYLEYVKLFYEDQEDFQSGARYIELDLFSKLTTGEYLKLFTEAGFLMDEIILELSWRSLLFSREYSELFSRIRHKYHDRCNFDDFLIKANFVRLIKPL